MARRGFVFCLLAVSAFADDRGHIAGKVSGQDQVGIGGVNITLLKNQAEVAIAISDEQGRYAFHGLQPGNYSIQYELGEGAAQEPSVDVRAGETAEVSTAVTFDVGLIATLTVYAASRQRERLMDAPAAVSSVSDTDVAMYAASGAIPNAVAALPGVMTGQAGLFDYNLNVRGMNIALNRRIQTTLDGRDPSIMLLSSQDWAALSVMTDDLQPIEMMRGPSGAFYGANSFNGVISMRTKDPRDSLGGTVRGSFGDPNQSKLEGRWATALGKDYFLKLTGGYNHARSFAQSRNVTVEYPGLLNEPVPLSTRTTDISAGSARLDKYLSSGRLLTFEGGGSSSRGLLLLTSTGRTFADGRRSWSRFHLEDRHWDVLAFSNTRSSNNVLGLGSGRLLTEHEATGAGEVRYRWDWGRNRFVTGADYTIEHVNTANAQGVQTLLSKPVFANKGSFFGQLDRKLTEALSIEVSGRVDASTLHPTQFSPRVAAVYALSPSQTIRATYNEGFEVASYVELFLEAPAGPPINLSQLETALAPATGGVPLGLSVVPLIALGNPNLRAEHIRTGEFGYTAILLRHGFFSVDFYHNWMKDFISDAFPGADPAVPAYKAPAAIPPPVQAVVAGTLNSAIPGLSNLANGDPYIAITLTNTGRIQSQGVEAELSTRIVGNWQTGATYAYFDFNVGEQKPGTQVHPNGPRHTFAAFGGYRSARFNADMRYRWVDGFYWANGLLTGPVPSYGVVDFTALYVVNRKYKLGVQVDNLANNVHYEIFGGDLLRRRVLSYVAYSW